MREYCYSYYPYYPYYPYNPYYPYYPNYTRHTPMYYARCGHSMASPSLKYDISVIICLI